MPTALRLNSSRATPKRFPRGSNRMNEEPVIGFGQAGTTCECSNAIGRGVHDDHKRARRVRRALGRVIVGQSEAIDLALVTLLAGDTR